MDVSECDTSDGLEHKIKKRKQEQFDDAPIGNNMSSVHSGSEDASSMDKILSGNDSASAMFIICSKLESETEKMCNVHEKKQDGDRKMSEDMATEHGNIIYSVEMEEPSSMDTYKVESGISEDTGGMRNHDDHENVANVTEELSEETVDARKDCHSREQFSDSGNHSPCNEQEFERDRSLKSSDVEQINGGGAVEEASVFGSVGEHDDETSTRKELITSTPCCIPPELDNAETVKEEVVCFSGSGETSSGVDAIIEEKTPTPVLDTSEKGDSIGCSRKKLLVLDVNGLLADFICYVPYGYKPDLVIGQKAGDNRHRQSRSFVFHFP